MILGGNDHVENEQDHPLVRADRGAGDVHCAVYCGEAADRGYGLPQRGKTYAESQQPGDETPVITGGDITITAHTFENMCTQNRASGMTETVAAQYTLARYIVTRSLYYQAVTDGYAAADAAVDAQNITLAAPYSRTLTRDNYNDAGMWPELTPSTAAPG